MKNKIKYFEFSGIKNITKPMRISFFATKSVTEESSEKNNIAVLYGPNGVGKSAFIQAISIYRTLAIEVNSMVKHKEYIEEYFNASCDEISLEICYLIFGKQKKAQEIVHKIVINKDMTIKEEKIISGQKQIIILGGQLNKNEKIDENKSMRFVNLLEESTFTSLYLKNFIYKNEKIKYYDEMIKNILYTVININIINESKDDNYIKVKINKLRSNNEHSENINESIKNFEKQKLITNSEITETNSYVLKSENLKRYKKEWEKIEKFLKMVKPQIKKIIIEEKKITEEKIKVDVFVKYENYKINILYESVGILKLMNLYNGLNNLVNEGSILIIDEFDAHLHDILINKIIEYIKDNENGQFIFTAHNLSIMNNVKNMQNSIHMIDLNLEVHTWKKNGNKSPLKAYQYGYITDDFKYGIFDMDEVLLDD